MRATAWLLLFEMVGVACTNASPDAKGGELTFDASSPCFVDVPAGGAPDAAATFTEVYDDYLGPNATKGCSNEPGNCHGGKGEPGEKASAYICTTKDVCYDTLTSTNSNLVNGARDAPDPTKSGLYLILRRKDAKGATVGSMPKRPACLWTPDALARIASWLDAGAPKN